MDHDALIAKLQKLLALAQRGEDGEAVNARDLLEKMLEKYGIDEASLTDIRTLRYSTENEDERGLLSVVASYALQIPTGEVEASVIVDSDLHGCDLKLTGEQHGLVYSLYEYHRMGLARSIQRNQEANASRGDALRAEIKALNDRVKVLKSLFANLDKTIAKARAAVLCAYVNLNNLTDYTGWSQADSDTGEIIQAATENCVKLDPDTKQLPWQRLGTPSQGND